MLWAVRSVCEDSLHGEEANMHMIMHDSLPTRHNKSVTFNESLLQAVNESYPELDANGTQVGAMHLDYAL